MNYLLVEVEDFYTAFNPISDKQLELIAPLITRINECVEYENFPYMGFDESELYEMYAELNDDGSVVDDDAAISTFLEYCPSTENGFQTVTKVEVYEVNHVDFRLPLSR